MASKDPSAVFDTEIPKKKNPKKSGNNLTCPRFHRNVPLAVLDAVPCTQIMFGAVPVLIAKGKKQQKKMATLPPKSGLLKPVPASSPLMQTSAFLPR